MEPSCNLILKKNELLCFPFPDVRLKFLPSVLTRPDERLGLYLYKWSEFYSTFKVRKGSREKILPVQGKEQRLCFAGAAVKRYPTSEVRETQVRRWVS